MKFENYKANSYQMRKNILHEHQDQQYTSDPNVQIRSSFSSIKQYELQIQEQASEHENKNVQFQASGTNEVPSIQGGNSVNSTQVQNSSNSPSKLLFFLGRNLENILNFQLNDEDEWNEEEGKQENNTPQNSQVKIQVQSQQEQKNQQPQNQNPQNQLKMIIFQPNQSKYQFIGRKIKEDERLSTLIQRQNGGMNFFLPQMNMIVRHDLKHILSCKKQTIGAFEYAISISNVYFEKKSPTFCGKVVGNFTNTIFNFIDNRTKSILCTTKFIQQKVLAPRIYQIYILNQGENYDDLAGVDGNCQKGLDELYIFNANKKKISHFINKKPQYMEKTQGYMLDFHGRAVKGSVKNFIIEDPKTGREVLMFGRGRGDTFNLDISAPLTPLLGLAIVVPHFASRILQQ